LIADDNHTSFLYQRNCLEALSPDSLICQERRSTSDFGVGGLVGACGEREKKFRHSNLNCYVRSAVSTAEEPNGRLIVS